MPWRGLLTDQDEIALDVVWKTTSYTVASSDDVILTTGTLTVTLPAAGDVEGKVFRVKKTDGVGTLTVDTNGGLIDGDSSVDITTQNEGITVISDGTDYWVF